ncbi:hypothetical protein [Nostoc flagelliforme]|nr:hypothetical protein [Nostoc flagelliforme]
MTLEKRESTVPTSKQANAVAQQANAVAQQANAVAQQANAVTQQANAVAQPDFSRDVEKGIDFCKRSTQPLVSVVRLLLCPFVTLLHWTDCEY